MDKIRDKEMIKALINKGSSLTDKDMITLLNRYDEKTLESLFSKYTYKEIKTYFDSAFGCGRIIDRLLKDCFL